MKTVKNRKRKFALGIKIAAMLSCVAIASVGFASWLIIQDTAPKSTGGNITASTVDDASLTFGDPSGTGNIVFGKSGTVTPTWLVAGSDVADDSLTATFTVAYTASNIKSATITVNFLAHVGAKPESGTWNEDTTRFATLMKYLNLEVSVAESTVSGNVVSGTLNGSYDSGFTPIELTLKGKDNGALASGSLTITVEFTWDYEVVSEIITKNPYEYFNSISSPSSDQKTAAKNMLSAIYNAVYNETKATTNTDTTDDLHYEVAITGTSSAS